MSILTRQNPIRARAGHISMVGHITEMELLISLRDVEVLNGFANRFLWPAVRRWQSLPDGGNRIDLKPLAKKLRAALDRSTKIGEMARSSDARILWHRAYERLTADAPGMYGAATARAEAQTLRLSMIYALLDGSKIIEVQHLRAALAAWDYCDASARRLFGQSSKNPDHDRVREALRNADQHGCTKSELHQATSNNLTSDKLDAILHEMKAANEAEMVPSDLSGRSGRPCERWRLTAKKTN